MRLLSGSSPDEAAGDTLLLRTHGTVPEEEARRRILHGERSLEERSHRETEGSHAG